MKLELVCQTTPADSHKQDIEAVVAAGSRIFSAADDGIIKIWSSEDLKLAHEFQAHDYAIIHLLVFGDRLYSASMDQTIKSWQLDTWRLVATFSGHEDTPKRLATDGENIYSGDDTGEVIKWTKDGKILARYGTLEEVWDLHIQNRYIFTVRDRGMTVTEMKEGSNNTPVVRTIEGRAPFYIHGDDLVMVDRTGMVIDHYMNKPPSYDFVQNLKGHERIITMMTGWGEFLLTSGYDDKIFLWNLQSGEVLSSFPVNGCPAAICATEEKGDIFVGCSDRTVIKLKVTS